MHSLTHTLSPPHTKPTAGGNSRGSWNLAELSNQATDRWMDDKGGEWGAKKMETGDTHWDVMAKAEDRTRHVENWERQVSAANSHREGHTNIVWDSSSVERGALSCRSTKKWLPLQRRRQTKRRNERCWRVVWWFVCWVLELDFRVCFSQKEW